MLLMLPASFNAYHSVRFPHPATFYGLLEMGSMYLPINSSWIDFQQRANQSYDDLNTKQKVLLQRLAEDALQKHNGSDKRYISKCRSGTSH